MTRRRPRRWQRWLGGTVLVLLALLVLAAGGGFLFLRSSLPDYDGTATIRGLTAEVTVANPKRKPPVKARCISSSSAAWDGCSSA